MTFSCIQKKSRRLCNNVQKHLLYTNGEQSNNTSIALFLRRINFCLENLIYGCIFDIFSRYPTITKPLFLFYSILFLVPR